MADLTATIVRKAQSRLAKFFSPQALASDGDHLFVHSWLRFYNDVEGRLKEVAPNCDAQSYADGLLFHEDELWACGNDGVVRCSDGGVSWDAVSLPSKESMRRITADPDGGLWVGGGYHGGGVVLYKAPRTKTFKTVKGPTDLVTAIAATKNGVLIGDRKGDIWRGTSGKLQKICSANASIRALLETSEGTIVGFGATEDEWESGVLLRSSNGGKKFTSTPQENYEEWILALGQVPDGPIIGGGDECVLVSNDDGKTFERLRQTLHAPCQSFTVAAVHGDALLIGGSCNHLVELRIGPKPAKKKPAKNSAAKKKPAKKKPAKKRAAKKRPTKKRAAKKKRR